MREIFATFRAAADAAQAEKMSAYMRHQFEFIGLATPKRRELSRDFLKSQDRTKIDWNFIFDCWQQAEREFQYLAIDSLVKHKKILSADDLPRLQQLVTTKSWWDSVDGLDSFVGQLAASNSEIAALMIDWSRADNIWLRRVAIDHQLGMKEQTDLSRLEKILRNNLNETEFFINKAMGWALRDVSKFDADWVRDFISANESGLSALTIREATKHMEKK